MKIDWKDPKKEMPKHGDYVAALRYHWKECWPLSAEIMFGEVEIHTDANGFITARINTCDFTGGGLYCWYFPTDGISDSDHIAAWAHTDQFQKPEFINHNPHWGKQK